MRMGSDDQLKHLRENGVRAEYSSDVASHDIIGIDSYTHFTSPLRRAADTICHILLKSVWYPDKISSTRVTYLIENLSSILDNLNATSIQLKKVQWDANKWAHFNRIHELCELGQHVNIQYKYESIVLLEYKQLVNLVITDINDIKCQIMYVVEVKPVVEVSETQPGTHRIQITYMDVGWNLNQGSLPELDSCIQSMYR